jgi:hypothetical protein
LVLTVLVAINGWPVKKAKRLRISMSQSRLCSSICATVPWKGRPVK